MQKRVETDFCGRTLILETGRVARQADGAVWVQSGDSVVLVTAVAAKTAKAGAPDFIPLTVEYQERLYAGGRIPGGFFKREGRPVEHEVLNSRLIDRPLRPLFPKGWIYETQIVASVISNDPDVSTDILAIIGASAALTISNIPLMASIGAVRVGWADGQYRLNPTPVEWGTGALRLVVAGSTDAIMMVEGESESLPEEIILGAIAFGHQALQTSIALQEKLREAVGRPKRLPMDHAVDEGLKRRMTEALVVPIQEAILIPGKLEQKAAIDKIVEGFSAEASAGEANRSDEVDAIFHEIERHEVRKLTLTKGIRVDGRAPTDIRPITCETGVLPRAHGSALFTRGETQSLSVATLGMAEDEQRIESLEGMTKKRFLLHYNFPGFSVGEVKPLRGPGRREIGHGALAERALRLSIPAHGDFPYTIRVVSDILESNGSSSMATVCGGTLCMMDAGIPIRKPVAGIAMGLIKEGEDIQILSDICGSEDHLGDMDFKVAGTAEGVTAIQIDIKVPGITIDIMKRALMQARVGRLHILETMLAALPESRTHFSPYTPRVTTLQVKKDKIREVIGQGGKVIRGIIEKTGVKMEIDDQGVIRIASADEKASQEAVAMVNAIVEEVEVGRIYTGKVVRIMDFGAFVELRKGVDGLVHISQLSHNRVAKVSDEVKEGEEIQVKVLEVDKQGKIRLSRKELLSPPA